MIGAYNPSVKTYWYKRELLVGRIIGFRISLDQLLNLFPKVMDPMVEVYLLSTLTELIENLK
jgi:hypothetical protein